MLLMAQRADDTYTIESSNFAWSHGTTASICSCPVGARMDRTATACAHMRYLIPRSRFKICNGQRCSLYRSPFPLVSCPHLILGPATETHTARAHGTPAAAHSTCVSFSFTILFLRVLPHSFPIRPFFIFYVQLFFELPF